MHTRPTFKRSFIVATVLGLGGVVGVPTASADASTQSTHQYQIGTFGEGCFGGCGGENHICCKIVIVEPT
jgi:hypothetical protein